MMLFKIQYFGLFLILIQVSNAFVLLTANFEDVKRIARKLFSEPVAEKLVDLIAKATGNVIPNVSKENEENVGNVDDISENEIESFNKAARQQATSKRYVMQTRKSTTESPPADYSETILEIVNQEQSKEKDYQTEQGNIPQKQMNRMTKHFKRITPTIGHNQAIEYFNPAVDENLRHKQHYQIKVPKGKLEISEEKSFYTKHKQSNIINQPEEILEAEQTYHKNPAPSILLLQKKETRNDQRPEREEEYKKIPRDQKKKETNGEVYVKEILENRQRPKILKDKFSHQTKENPIEYLPSSDQKPETEYFYKKVYDREIVEDDREKVVRDKQGDINDNTVVREKDTEKYVINSERVEKSRSLNMDKAQIKKARQEYWSKLRWPQFVNRPESDNINEVPNTLIKKRRKINKRTFRTNSGSPNDEGQSDIKIDMNPKVEEIEPVETENLDTNLQTEEDGQKHKKHENNSKGKTNATLSKLNIEFAPIDFQNTNYNKKTDNAIMRAADAMTVKDKSDFDQYDLQHNYTPVVATAGPIILKRLSEKWWEKEMPKSSNSIK